MMPEDAEPRTITESHQLKGTRESMDFVQHSILDAMESLGYAEEDLFAVRIAIEEAIANAILHGHQGDQERTIDVRWSIDKNKVVMVVCDSGRGYDESAVPDPTADENLTLPSGRGLAMIKAFMSQVTISENGRRIEMTRERLR
ncbi:MAG: ATP-binding protein [Planctomycetes bacterium]|nr:ATP-binding protein [Planctomycetota bacterium]